MTHTIEEIKAMLAAATPGPWNSEYAYSGFHCATISANEKWIIIAKCDDYFRDIQNDATLIAAAPTIIKELLDEVERLQDTKVTLAAIIKQNTCYKCAEDL